jgi:GAF domain-containing protein
LYREVVTSISRKSEERLSRWLLALLGLLLTGLSWPLAFYSARFKASRLDPAHEPDVLGSLAAATRDHPWAGFLVWLILTVLAVLWLFKPGRHEVKLGPLSIGIPDAIRTAEERVRSAEDAYDTALQAVAEYAALIDLLTSLPAQRDARFARQLLEEICKVGALTITIGKRCQSSIWLQDIQTGELRIRASHRVRPKTVESFRLRVGQGFAGQVFRSGKERVILEVGREVAYEVLENPYSPAKPTSIMGLPLFSAGQVVGVLCFSHQEPREKGFDGRALELAQPYATLGSLVLTIMSQAGIPLP